MSEKIWADDAWEDYLYWQTQDKKILKRINHLIQDIKPVFDMLPVKAFTGKLIGGG